MENQLPQLHLQTVRQVQREVAHVVTILAKGSKVSSMGICNRVTHLHQQLEAAERDLQRTAAFPEICSARVHLTDADFVLGAGPACGTVAAAARRELHGAVQNLETAAGHLQALPQLPLDDRTELLSWHKQRVDSVGARVAELAAQSLPSTSEAGPLLATKRVAALSAELDQTVDDLCGTPEWEQVLMAQQQLTQAWSAVALGPRPAHDGVDTELRATAARATDYLRLAAEHLQGASVGLQRGLDQINAGPYVVREHLYGVRQTERALSGLQQRFPDGVGWHMDNLELKCELRRLANGLELAVRELNGDAQAYVRAAQVRITDTHLHLLAGPEEISSLLPREASLIAARDGLVNRRVSREFDQALIYLELGAMAMEQDIAARKLGRAVRTEDRIWLRHFEVTTLVLWELQGLQRRLVMFALFSIHDDRALQGHLLGLAGRLSVVTQPPQAHQAALHLDVARQILAKGRTGKDLQQALTMTMAAHTLMRHDLAPESRQ